MNKLVNELRLGNWIKGTPKNKGELKEFQVYNETFADIESTYGIFELIPLTEYWLVKFGFKKNDWGYEHYIRVGDKKIEVHPRSSMLVTTLDIVIKRECKFVHQLQNIIFSLTEHELEINN